MCYCWALETVVLKGVGIRGIADLAGGKLWHVPCPADLPHRPVAEPQASGDDIVTANHKACATISRRVIHEVLVMLNGHTSIPLSFTTDPGRDAGSTVYHPLV